MVSAPRKIVSSFPLDFRSRSVKIWPRSGSALSWISSTIRHSTDKFLGIASTVQIQYFAPVGTIRSSPVTRATHEDPRILRILS